MSARVLRNTVTLLKKALEAHRVAAKHARRKRTLESSKRLATTSKDIQEEIDDTKSVLRNAEGKGFSTKACQDTLELAVEALRDSDAEVCQRLNERLREEEEARIQAKVSADKKRKKKKTPEKEEKEEGEPSDEKKGTKGKCPEEGKTKGKKAAATPKTRKATPMPPVEEEGEEEFPEGEKEEKKKTPKKGKTKGKKAEATPKSPKVALTHVTKTESKSSTKSRAETEAEDATDKRRTIEADLKVRKAKAKAHDARRKAEDARRKAEDAVIRAQEEALEIAIEIESKLSDRLEESSRASESESEDEGESSPEEDDEVEDGGRTPVGVATAPTDKRTSAWVKKAKKQADKDKKSVKDDLSQTTAAALRQQQLLLAGGGMGTSLLEGIKILERRRPAEKFTGDGKIDFEDHMAQFNKAMNVPGLPASQKLAELPEWFGGLARVQISKFMRREDHEEALKGAVAKLTKEHGSKATTAEEMLQGLLQGKALKQNDAAEMDMAISKLEEAFFLAVETDRDGDFNRRSLFKTIITALFPHLRAKWGVWIAKALENGKTVTKFEDFLAFLTYQKRIAYEVQRLEVPKATPSEEAKPEAKTKTKGQNETRPRKEEAEEEEEFTKVTRPRRAKSENEQTKQGPAGQQRKSTAKQECHLCKEIHWLHECPKFVAMSPDQRMECCEKQKICFNCIRWSSHRVEDCTYKKPCGVCGKQHNTQVHGAAKLALWEAKREPERGSEE